MSNVLAGKVILVTGGTGSIGCEIVRQALSRGAGKVVVFSRDEVKHFIMRKEISDDRLETIVGDVRDWKSLEQVFRSFDIDIVYHAAAMKHVIMCEDFPLESVQTNILGTQNVVNLSLEYRVPKMITISTDKAAYPVNVMGACKFIAEKITMNANKKTRAKQSYSCVRFGNVANSRGSVIPVYVEDLLHRRPLQVTDPDVTRFIMEIPDAAKLVIKATEYAKGGEIFILRMRAFKLGDLVDVMREKIAPRLNILNSDVKINVTGLVTGEKLHEDLISHDELSRLYELDDMYILLEDKDCCAKYPSINEVSLSRYTSSDVEHISNDELEQMVVKYLAKQPRV